MFACPLDLRACNRVIASIEEQTVIDRILAHLGRDDAAVDSADQSRGPPESLPF